MKYLAILALLLASCGASGSPAQAPTAPNFDAVPLAFDNEPWTSHTGAFGCRVLFGGGQPSYLGWASSEGAALTEVDVGPVAFWTEWSPGNGYTTVEFLMDDDAGAPPAGWLYVEALVAGMKYAALINYVPGFNDGWTITRNDLWFE